jgi:hypothetical protein
MEKTGIIVTGITAFYSLIGCIMTFLMTGGIAHRQGFRFGAEMLTRDDMFLLLSLGVFVYLLMLFIKIKKDTEFLKAYKTTLHLLIWSSLVVIVPVSFYSVVVIWYIIFVSANYAESFILVFYALFYGMPIVSILSLAGFAIDSILNKIKENQLSEN